MALVACNSVIAIAIAYPSPFLVVFYHHYKPVKGLYYIVKPNGVRKIGRDVSLVGSRGVAQAGSGSVAPV